MIKRVLIFGNDEGLAGVKVDMQEYKKFFKSSFGGSWDDSEIIERLDPSRSSLLTDLTNLKRLSLDFLIIVFSGHGGEQLGTILEINPAGETIYESELKDIADRQINIFDCCRCYPTSLSKAVVDMFESKAYSAISTRERYERRIMQSVSQQVYLYACSRGESAYDTKDGGIYSKHLLESAIKRDRDFTLVGTAHAEASVLTTAEQSKQHPDALLPRCLSSQQLILSIKP
jgi:hypothetical protein